MDGHESLLQGIARNASNKAHNDFLVSVQYYNLSYMLLFFCCCVFGVFFLFFLFYTRETKERKSACYEQQIFFMKLVFYLAWISSLKQKCHRHQSFWNIIKNLWICSQLCLWGFIWALKLYLLSDTFFMTVWLSKEYMEDFIWFDLSFLFVSIHFVGFY